ncbi:MAG: hypothetical protein HQM16_10730 [Deltaproteobacteria bacterium]|nr:hypothetical protein [Deltaproteobacteria bacterium]
MKKLSIFLVLSFLVACFGSGGGGGSDNANTTSYGDDLNTSYMVEDITCTGTVTGGTFSAGSFSVVVADNAMTACTNATSPAADTEAELPTGLDVDSDLGEQNVTTGAVAYSFELGERDFETDNENDVTVTVPFDISLVPLADRTSLKVFIRILNL